MLDTQEMSRQCLGQTLLLEGHYIQAINFYEQAIETEPDVVKHYWYLGLAYLLQGQEEGAEASWLLGMSQLDPEDIEQGSRELSKILNAEAKRQLDLNNTQTAWLIRQHLREIVPTDINNLLYLLLLSCILGSFTPELFKDWQVIELLEQVLPEEVDSDLLLKIIEHALEFHTEETLTFITVCLPHAKPPEIFIAKLLPFAVKIAYRYHRPDFAAKLLEFCLKLRPEHPGILQHLSCFYSNAGEHQKAIATAKQFYNNCKTIDWQILGSYLVLRAILSAASWLEVAELAQRHESHLLQLIQEQPENLTKGSSLGLVISPFFLPFIQDNLQKNRWFHNQVGKLFQKNLSNISGSSPFIHSRSIEKPRALRIGYVGHTFRIHSVGWLCRWLFQHCDRELFSTTIYCINQNLEDSFTQAWFGNKVDAIHTFPMDAPAIANQIYKDEIDILIEVDSITLDTTCEVMAMKPAPIQVSWLGWDATGLPAVDYFIADPYVVSDNAQDHYQETIWRLPQTYIAVDGFEVGTPTLSRKDLQIPTDAVVYLSGQKGYKRHPDTVRLQMQILKEVPDSYFLIKGIADESTIQEFFTRIAEEVGVDAQRLRFLPRDSNELTHRANLAIADVVLDTYPFNGATTTLEVLWMGIPLVTRVGEQFAARNSYAFMMNVGVTEGIAWTDEEYVEWGVRLGKDPHLRQQIAWRLWQSRRTSPLWNAKQFTREMEKAYQQMWQKYESTLL